MDLFTQDDWKISRRLTLNLGLRSDFYIYPYEQHNNQSNYDIASGTLLVAGLNGKSRSLANTDKNNIAPRIGFAYEVFGTGKRSVRGGYGIFYFLDRGGIGNQLSKQSRLQGVCSYRAADGYRITFTGQAASGNNDSSTATAALPLPPFGPSSVNTEDPSGYNLISQVKITRTAMCRNGTCRCSNRLTMRLRSMLLMCIQSPTTS